MAKFFGKIGYGVSIEVAPGSWQDTIVERDHYGDILKNNRKLVDGQYQNLNLTINNSISIVTDAYASEHFHAIRYVRWAGACWVVNNVEVQRPRLILDLGEVYNGPTP